MEGDEVTIQSDIRLEYFCSIKNEQRMLLDTGLNPVVRLHRISILPPDLQQLLVIKEEKERPVSVMW